MLKLIKIEFIKTYRDYQVWLFYAIPIFFIFQGFIKTITKPSSNFENFFLPNEPRNPWIYYFDQQSFNTFYLLIFFYPLLITDISHTYFKI